MTDEPHIHTDAPRGILSAMRSERVLDKGRREQAKVLALWPCMVSGHHWRAFRDAIRANDAPLYLICRDCGTEYNWSHERNRAEGVGT